MRVGPRFPVRAGIVPGGACRRVTCGRACRNRAHDPRIGVTGASCDLRASELCPVQPTSAKSLPPSGPCPQPCSSLVVLYRVGALRERRQPVSCSRSHGAVGPLDETPTAPAAPACGFCETPTTPACPKRKKSGRCGGTGVVAVSPGVGEGRTDSAQRRWSHALGGRAWTPAGGRKPVAGTVRVAGELGRDIPYPAPSPGAPRHRRPDTTKHAEPNAPVGAKAARSGRVWSPGHTGSACSTTVRRRSASAHLR